MPGLRFYWLQFNRNLLCWSSFQKLQQRRRSHSLLFMRLHMRCKTSSVLARLPTFPANILKRHLSLKRKSSEDKIKRHMRVFISFMCHTLHINEKHPQEKEKLLYDHETKDLIPYRLPFRFIVDDYY